MSFKTKVYTLMMVLWLSGLGYIIYIAYGQMTHIQNQLEIMNEKVYNRN